MSENLPTQIENQNESQRVSPIALARQQTLNRLDMRNANSVAEIIEIGRILYASKMFPDVQSAEYATAKIMMGSALGLSPVESINTLHIVKGKLFIGYPTLIAQLRRNGYRLRWIERTPTVAEVEFIDPTGEPIGTYRFTIDMAKKMGVGNLDKMPEVMLCARCVSAGVRLFCPEAMYGVPVYVDGEIPEDTTIIEVENPASAPTDQADRLALEIGGKQPKKEREPQPEVAETDQEEPAPDFPFGGDVKEDTAPIEAEVVEEQPVKPQEPKQEEAKSDDSTAPLLEDLIDKFNLTPANVRLLKTEAISLKLELVDLLDRARDNNVDESMTGVLNYIKAIKGGSN